MSLMCSVTCSPIDTLPVPASTGAPAAIEVAPNNLGAARRRTDRPHSPTKRWRSTSVPAITGASTGPRRAVRPGATASASWTPLMAMSAPRFTSRARPATSADRPIATIAAACLRRVATIAGHSREHLAIPCNLYPHPRLVTSYSRISCRIARLYPMEVVPYGFAFVI